MAVFEGEIDTGFADDTLRFELHLLQGLGREAFGKLHDDGNFLRFSK